MAGERAAEDLDGAGRPPGGGAFAPSSHGAAWGPRGGS